MAFEKMFFRPFLLALCTNRDTKLLFTENVIYIYVQCSSQNSLSYSNLCPFIYVWKNGFPYLPLLQCNIKPIKNPHDMTQCMLHNKPLQPQLHYYTILNSFSRLFYRQYSRLGFQYLTLYLTKQFQTLCSTQNNQRRTSTLGSICISLFPTLKHSDLAVVEGAHGPSTATRKKTCTTHGLSCQQQQLISSLVLSVDPLSISYLLRIKKAPSAEERHVSRITRTIYSTHIFSPICTHVYLPQHMLMHQTVNRSSMTSIGIIYCHKTRMICTELSRFI